MQQRGGGGGVSKLRKQSLPKHMNEQGKRCFVFIISIVVVVVVVLVVVVATRRLAEFGFSQKLFSGWLGPPIDENNHIQLFGWETLT